MATVSSTMANNSIVDGAEFVRPCPDYDMRQIICNNLFMFFAQAEGIDIADAKKLIRVHILGPHEYRAQHALKISITGKIAKHVLSMPDMWTQYLTELHLKTYLIERPGADLVAFRRALLESEVGTMTSSARSKASERSAKSSGEVQVRQGSRKSNKHAVLYRRRSQSHGYEVRLQGETLTRIRQQSTQLASALHDDSQPANLWQYIKSMAAIEGYAHFEKDAFKKGAVFAKVFQYATTYPWNDYASKPELAYLEELDPHYHTPGATEREADYPALTDQNQQYDLFDQSEGN